MPLDRFSLAANTSAYAGYDLEVALAHIAAIGYRRVEIAAMVGIVEHVTQDRLTAAEARRIRGLLRAHGLETVAFSAHLFLAREGAAEAFLPRLEFAKELGAEIVNTKAGDPAFMATFLRNMEILLKHAERLGLKIGLETHGDIVTHGRAAVEAVARFATPSLILNYDFGNVLVNSRGTVDPAADFAAIATEVGHLHFKDVLPVGDSWQMVAVGSGVIDFEKVFATLARLPRTIPATVDLPLGLVLTKDAQVRLLETPRSLAEIDEILCASLEFIAARWSDGQPE
ncbi:MAG: sugar phosphate isomerase/epimerase family protein [Bacillota bacterium]